MKIILLHLWKDIGALYVGIKAVVNTERVFSAPIA